MKDSITFPQSLQTRFLARLNIACKLVVMSPAIFLFDAAHAQNAGALIEVEKAFARMAAESSVRTAFLTNLDSSGVTFQAGKILNGRKQFSAAKESSIKLLWHPVYACLSSAGDLGFTTGPFEVRKAMDSGAVAAGQYSSVWKKNSEGEWKLMVDLGIDFTTSLYNTGAATAAFTGLLPLVDQKDKLEAEEAFLKAYKEKGVAAFEKLIGDGSWFNFQNHHPLTTKATILRALKEIPEDLVFKPVGSEVSSAGDMLYVYGEVSSKNKQENYLRVWVHTTNGWMLLLQTLRW